MIVSNREELSLSIATRDEFGCLIFRDEQEMLIVFRNEEEILIVREEERILSATIASLRYCAGRRSSSFYKCV